MAHTNQHSHCCGEPCKMEWQEWKDMQNMSSKKERRSWRVSLQNTVGKSIRALVSGTEKDTLSNDIVRYRGLSLETLVDINKRLLCNEAAEGVKLFVLKKKVDDVEAGRTVEHTRMKGSVKGSFIARVPFRNLRLEIPESSVVEKERQEWTIEDVCEFFVLPEALKDDSFFLDCISTNNVGKPFQGAFVSQARKSSFSGLVEALKHHYKGRDPCQVFLWIDIFCANQPLLTRKDRGLRDDVKEERWNLLNKGLHEAIDRFEDRLIFFNAWDNPFPLQRAWCIWEIYGAARSSKNLDIIFDPSASQDVIDKLLDDSDSLLQAMSNLDPRKMECHDAHDLEMIKSAVQTLDGGFSGLKATITGRLRLWLLETVENAVKAQEIQQPDSSEFADLLIAAGNFMLSMDEKEVALSYYKTALKIYKETLGERHPEVADTYNGMAIVYKNQGKYSEALEMYSKALEIYEETLDQQHPSFAATYNNMGNVYDNQGKYNDALEMYNKALEIYKETLGERHLSVAQAYNNMGNVYDSQGRYDEALEMYEKDLEISIEKLGERHPSVAQIYNNMAVVFQNQGKDSEALEMYSKALEIYKETLDERHLSVAQTYNNMGLVCENQGKYDEALEMYSRALEIKKETLGELHPSVAQTYNNMGNVYESQGKYSEALDMYKKDLEISKEVLGKWHPSVAATYNNIAIVYENQGKHDEALEMHSKALEIKKEALGEQHPSVAQTYNNMGNVYESQGKYDEALEMYKKDLDITREAFGERHPSVATTYNNMAIVYKNQGKYDEALKMYSKALEIKIESLGERHPSVAQAYNSMGLVYETQGKYTDAHECFAMALTIAKDTLGANHPDTTDFQLGFDRTK